MNRRHVQEDSSIRPLKGFLEKARDDHRIGVRHISLYVTMLTLSSTDGLLHVKKKELMRMSKMSGKTAYYRCLKELAEYGYIEYWQEHYAGGSMARLVSL
jgi:hypothetical protein